MNQGNSWKQHRQFNKKGKTQFWDWTDPHLICLVSSYHCHPGGLVCILTYLRPCRRLWWEEVPRGLHRTCYNNQVAASGWSILCLDPKQEVIFLVKGKRINYLPHSYTSRNTHRMQKVRSTTAAGKQAHVYNTEITFHKTYWRTDQKCPSMGIKGPEDVAFWYK